MTKLMIDVDKIRESSQNMLRLNKEYQELINGLILRMSAISNSNIWTGKAANNYVNQVINFDKKNFLGLARVIEDYGNFLQNSAAEVKIAIERVKL